MRRSRPLLYAIFVLVGASLAALRLRGDGTAVVRRTDWPVNFAHRGDSSRAPENTLESFALGLGAGAAGLELDVHLSRDGEFFVIHDPTVDRTTDGEGEISTLTSDGIKVLDAGYRFSTDGVGLPHRDKDVRIPTLGEVYETFPEAFVNIDMKSDEVGVEARLLREIFAAGAAKRTLVASESHRKLVRFRRLAQGRVPTSASKPEILVFILAVRLGLWKFLKPDYSALQVPVSTGRFEVVTSAFVGAAKKLGVRVDVWTVNDPDEMRRLLDLGVDAIMTDRPATLSEVLRDG